VKQDITSLTLVHGGRVQNVLAPPPAAVTGRGDHPPAPQPKSDTSGRIVLFFIDDLHLGIQSTPKIRALVKRMAKTLLHEGDLFGVISSGPSSIALDLTYDRRRMDEVVQMITGHGLEPDEIINGAETVDGPSEIIYRAHTAFSTVERRSAAAEQVHNRRKAVIYVSDGYDFDSVCRRAARHIRRPRQEGVRQPPGQGSGGGGQESPDATKADVAAARRERSGASACRPDPCGQPGERDVLHDRPAWSRPGVGCP